MKTVMVSPQAKSTTCPISSASNWAHATPIINDMANVKMPVACKHVADVSSRRIHCGVYGRGGRERLLEEDEREEERKSESERAGSGATREGGTREGKGGRVGKREVDREGGSTE